jgi:hypothetical protein
MNPALHVAHYVMAWAAVRNNQATWDLIQTCNIATIEPRVVIVCFVCLLLVIWFSLYFWYKSYKYKAEFEAEYRSMRINQIYKALKK